VEDRIGPQPIAERHLAALWSAIRDAHEIVERGALDSFLGSPEVVPLLRSLAGDARKLADALAHRVGNESFAPATGLSPPERPTVLMIDDDEVALDALGTLLADDFRVITTTNPGEVTRLLRQQVVDAVVTDMRMPGIDGLGVLELVEAAGTPAPPVLMMSGYLDAGQRLRALERGVFDFQRKPIDPAELTTRLRQAVRYAQELEHQRLLQQTDDLTGLFNRRALHACLAAALERGRQNREPVALAIVDQDWLKQINDAYGHAAGDRSIVAIASLLSRTRRSSDSVARMGGDEFALVMPNTGAEGASQLLERFTGALAESPIDLAPSVRVPLSVSYGIASTGPETFDSPDALLASADGALYAMKRAKHGPGTRSPRPAADPG
jgi:diguanylate cyclase (GGDEF)-like protein